MPKKRPYTREQLKCAAEIVKRGYRLPSRPGSPLRSTTRPGFVVTPVDLASWSSLSGLIEHAMAHHSLNADEAADWLREHRNC